MVNIIEPSYIVLSEINTEKILKQIEISARTCYKSEDLITDESSKCLLQKLVKNKHFAMIEHAGTISVKLICDRGVSHEIVRHRICSFAQESTRYCDYTKNKFGNNITVIQPLIFKNIDLRESPEYRLWKDAMEISETAYFSLRSLGIEPQIARSVLPTALKTEIVITANLREWHTIFELRCAPVAHPEMRRLMIPLCREFKEKIPYIFDDINL